MSFKTKMVQLLRSIVATVLMLAITLFIAGRVDYWQGWVFAILIGFASLTQNVVFAQNKSLAKERRRPGAGVKIWDWVFMALFGTAVPAVFAIGVLDSGRFSWAGEFPVGLIVLGAAMLLLGTIGFFWPMWENNWFATMVRIQDDREHKVVTTGPYRFVRHPGYVGAILMIVGMPLLFGSSLAWIPASVAILLLLIRTKLEDATLQKELVGYKEYTAKVRYKIIPGLF